MSLRRRLQFIVVFWTATVLAGAVLFLRPWVLSGYEVLERDLLERDIERVRHGVDLQLGELRKYLKPFAAWDATYDYISDWDHASYIEKEYAASVLRAEGVDTVVFVRSDRKAGALVRAGRNGALKVTTQRGEWIKFADVWGHEALVTGEGNTLHVIDGVAYALAHAEILHSNGDGPPAGQLIMASPITEAFVADVDRIVGLGLSLDPSGVVSPSVLEGIPAVVGMTSEALALRIPFLDSRGATPLTIAYKAPRDVMRAGRNSNNVALALFLSSSVVFGSVLHILLDKVVVKRLEEFNDEIARVQLDPGSLPLASAPPTLVDDGFDDEISLLKHRAQAAFQRIAELEEARSKAHAQLAAQANLSRLGEMAGGIAHEINNPMTIVKGTCMKAAVLLDARSPDTEAVRACLLKIEATADRVAEIVRSMRTFARDGSGDPTVPIEVSSIVDQSLSLLEFRYEGVRQRVEVELWPGMRVDCREVQAVQIVTILLSNALDAASAAPGARVRLTARLENGELLLAVLDQGPGLQNGAEERMFQPFFTTKEVGSGTGLGLAIARSLAQRHGGRIDFARDAGWTCFSLVLPMDGDILRAERLTS